MKWKTLGAVKPAELVDARLQLHHGAQVVASAGVTFLEPRPDDGHPNFGWMESLDALVGRALPVSNSRVGLRVSDLSLLLVDANNEVNAEFSLEGRTLEEGYAWLASATAGIGEKLPEEGLTRANYELPSHPTGNGGIFSTAPGAAFAELAHWFANGDRVLVELAGRTPGASDVRCWPHHLDVGALVSVATQPDGNLAKSIGIGLSPGDDGYAEPYWYVSPWPYPDPGVLPSLENGGHWHTTHYTSAILTGTDLVDGPSESQEDRLRAFLAAAVDACTRVLAD